MLPKTRCNTRGLGALEVLAVTTALAVLLGLGYSVYKGARLAARVAIAESNLKQVGTALELYLLKHGSYPPEGADLAYVLKPFLASPDALRNPLMDEAAPGQTLSDLYIEPSLSDIDRPNIYLTAFPADNGSTLVVLKTGGKVERLDGLAFDPSDTDGIIALLTARGTSPQPTPPTPGTWEMSGELNLNPNNRDDFEFEMQTGDGTTITRDDLHDSNGKFTYEGTAARIRFRPKGNGNQNGIILNGKPYPLSNSTTYLILVMQDASGGFMCQVKLYNRKTKGKAMGQWWMSLKTPPNGAQLYIVTPGPDGKGETLTLVVDNN